ncbi:MAG: thiamine-phosphate kinase [Gammaproteobacteria bacterium]|nr:thiamine-phosphate kinase [Gammaproteobacteria bacterium]
MREFSLIEKYFSSQTRQRKNNHTALGIGDDAAIINVPADQQLVVTMDTLIANVHFPAETSPHDIAYKSLAVNVSDLVAMAATPAYFLLSLSMPAADESFMKAFSAGLFEAADKFNIALVGGDTCKGPLSISIQASGFVTENNYVTRSGASIGDKIFVSGQLGAAALGLAIIQQKINLTDAQTTHCVNALNRPEPRVDLIDLLKKFASSAIDLSDGLVGDLGHILTSSDVGAVIDRNKIPACLGLQVHGLFEYALTGGDDYQILFTVADDDLTNLIIAAGQLGLELFEIGEIVDQGYVLLDQDKSIDLAIGYSTLRGFDHFDA